MSSEERNRQAGYPFYSPLLVSAFNVDSCGDSIACSVVSGTFSVVRRIPNRSRTNYNSAYPIFSLPVSRTGLQIPSCVEYQSQNERQRTNAGATVHGPTYIFRDDILITRIFPQNLCFSVKFTMRSSISCTYWPSALEKYPGL